MQESHAELSGGSRVAGARSTVRACEHRAATGNRRLARALRSSGPLPCRALIQCVECSC